MKREADGIDFERFCLCGDSNSVLTATVAFSAAAACSCVFMTPPSLTARHPRSFSVFVVSWAWWWMLFISLTTRKGFFRKDDGIGSDGNGNDDDDDAFDPLALAFVCCVDSSSGSGSDESVLSCRCFNCSSRARRSSFGSSCWLSVAFLACRYTEVVILWKSDETMWRQEWFEDTVMGTWNAVSGPLQRQDAGSVSCLRNGVAKTSVHNSNFRSSKYSYSWNKNTCTVINKYCISQEDEDDYNNYYYYKSHSWTVATWSERLKRAPHQW